jgi:hypothetical protein
LIMYNIRNDFKKRVKLIISGSFFIWNNIIGSHSGNSFQFSHRPTGFLNYALFCLSCLPLNLKPVNYLTTRRSSMAKRQGSILSFFGNANGPTQQKTTKSYEYWMSCLPNVQSLLFIMIIYESLLLVN